MEFEIGQVMEPKQNQIFGDGSSNKTKVKMEFGDGSSNKTRVLEKNTASVNTQPLLLIKSGTPHILNHLSSFYGSKVAILATRGTIP